VSFIIAGSLIYIDRVGFKASLNFSELNNFCHLWLAACRTSSSRLLNKTASPFWPDQPVLVFSRIFRPPLIKFFVLVDRSLLSSSETAAVGGFRSF